VLARVIALVALAWLALLVAAPSGPSAPAALIYAIGAIVCHQIPERSFHLAGYQIPVCARCLGIYAGFALAAAACLVTRFGRASARVGHLTARAARCVIVVSALPTAATLGLEWTGVWRGTNIIRACAGAALGIGIAFVVMSAVATLHYSGCERRRPTGPSRLQPPI
jgi:uncharacterized membrane protein